MCEFRVLKMLPNGKYLFERNVNGKKILLEGDYYTLMFHVNFMKASNPKVIWVGEERKRG